MEKYRCPYTGCSSAFGTVSGVRKHWQSKHPGEVPTLIAADLLVEQNSLEQREMVSDHSDNDLIVMMGLTNNECAIDFRSAGRFARCSELEFQAPVAVTITVSEPNPWKLATGAFFAATCPTGLAILPECPPPRRPFTGSCCCWLMDDVEQAISSELKTAIFVRLNDFLIMSNSCDYSITLREAM